MAIVSQLPTMYNVHHYNNGVIEHLKKKDLANPICKFEKLTTSRKMYGKIVSLVEKKNIIQNFNGVVLDETLRLLKIIQH
jgi:hypothetical protein